MMTSYHTGTRDMSQMQMETPIVRRRTDEGYRYVRSYRVASAPHSRWALWERRDGRMKRVGTACTEQDCRDFMFERGAWVRQGSVDEQDEILTDERRNPSC